MKRLGLAILTLGFTFFANAQTDELIEKEGKIYLNEKLYSGSQEVIKDNNLSSTFIIKNGLRDGKVTHYYTSEKVKEIGYYAKGEKNNKWEKWNKKGSKIGEAYYTDGKKNGTWVVWDDKGIKRYEMHYLNGQKTGVWKIWNEKGLLMEEKEF